MCRKTIGKERLIIEEVGMILDRKVRKSGRTEEGMENKMKQRMLICSSEIER